METKQSVQLVCLMVWERFVFHPIFTWMNAALKDVHKPNCFTVFELVYTIVKYTVWKNSSLLKELLKYDC